MRWWPLVWRSTADYDRLWCEQLRKERDEDRNDSERRLLEERERYEALLDKYHALRQEGAVLPRSEAVPVAEPDVVAQAIVIASVGNRRLLKPLGEYASAQRVLGVDDADIAKHLLNWDTDDEWLPAE